MPTPSGNTASSAMPTIWINAETMKRVRWLTLSDRRMKTK